MAFLIIKAASAVNVLPEYHKLWHVSYVSCVCAHVPYLLNYLEGGWVACFF